MAQKSQCDSYPDIWQELPPKPKPDEDNSDYQRAVQDNLLHGRVYRAARHILIEDFGLPKEVPASPEDFPGNPGQLDEAVIAQMAAVQGLLLADDWEPTQGKSRPVPGSGDLFIHAGHEYIVVDRRFVDAVVSAVQEFTSNAKLFKKCLQFLRQEGQQDGADTGPSGPPTRKPPAAPAVT